jgi:flavoprotein
MLKRNEQDIENLAKVSKKVDIEGEVIEDPESIPEILEG